MKSFKVFSGAIEAQEDHKTLPEDFFGDSHLSDDVF
jgi:hypothetical protein